MQHHYAAKAVLCLNRRKAEVEQNYTIALDEEVNDRLLS
jgi:hypothetical protein